MVPMMFAHTPAKRSNDPGSPRSSPPPSNASDMPSTISTYACASSASFEP